MNLKSINLRLYFELLFISIDSSIILTPFKFVLKLNEKS